MPFDPTYLDNLPGTADTPKSAVDKLNANLLAIKNAIAGIDDTLIARTSLILTPDEKSALMGTSGTSPSIANKFVDDADPRLEAQAIPDATHTIKGIVKLDGHLGGTAASPKVVGIQSGVNSFTIGTIDDQQLVYLDGNIIKGQDMPSGFSTPTGTGLRAVVGGSEETESVLITNTWVADAAGITESKLALNNATHATTNDPSTGQKAALAGSSGTPGSGNKYLTQDEKAAASGLASLSSGSKVVEDPANATATPTASKIPIADGAGKLDGWITPDKGSVKYLRYIIDGGGAVITTGDKLWVTLPYACTVNAYWIASDVSTTTTVSMWKQPWGTMPTISNIITASAPMALSTAQFNTSSTLTGWTTSVTAMDVIKFAVVSNNNATRLEILVKVTVS